MQAERNNEDWGVLNFWCSVLLAIALFIGAAALLGSLCSCSRLRDTNAVTGR